MRDPLRAISIAIVVGAVLATSMFAQSSPTYKMARIGFATGVGSAASQNYQSSLTISPDSRSGAASRCNTGLQVSLGLWTTAGALPVPIELSVRPGRTDSQDVELTWTGADALFHIYRGSSPADLTNPLNLYQETDLCGFTDLSAQQEPILYYLVLPRP